MAPSKNRIREVIGHRYRDDQPDGYRAADDLVFDLVAALGVKRIGVTLPYSFEIDAAPFSFVASGGLGQLARSRATYRSYASKQGEPCEPAQSWEAEAVELETLLWSAIHDETTDPAELARRSEWVVEAFEAARAGRPAPPQYMSRTDRAIVHPEHLQQNLYDQIVAGRLNPPQRASFDRQMADRRAFNPDGRPAG